MKRFGSSERDCASPWCDRVIAWWRRGPYCSTTCADDHATYVDHRRSA